MRTIVYFLMLITIGHQLNAQCMLTANDGGEAGDDYEKSSGDIRVDQKIRQTVTQFNRLLGTKVLFFFYDDSDGSNAYASSEDNNIYIGKQLLSECLNGPSGMTGLGYILAHEMAHIYQYTKQENNEFFEENSVEHLELQADFIAAYLMGKTGQITNSVNYWQMLKQSIEIGDFIFDSENHHGTSAQREYTVKRGFEHRNSPISDAYSSSFEYVKPSYIDPDRLGSLVYTVFLNRGNAFYVYYGGKICIKKSGNIEQVGQMVSNDHYFYQFRFNFSKEGYTDFFMGADFFIYNQAGMKIGYVRQ